MRRARFVLVMMVSIVAIGSAQQEVQIPRNSPIEDGALARARAEALARMPRVELIVDRLMAFDRNHDGRVAKTELPERMQAIVADGDVDGDGTLDDAEIRTLSRRTATSVGSQIGGYAFGDQVGVSSRSHVEGAIEDLRLADAAHEQTLAIASAFLDRREARGLVTLSDRLQGVLSAEQLAEVTRAAERRLGRPAVAFQPRNGSDVRLIFNAADGRTPVELRGLSTEQASQTVQAFVAFMGAPLTNADRAELLDQMKESLSDEERDNLRAALERRPLVKAGIVGGVVQGIIK